MLASDNESVWRNLRSKKRRIHCVLRKNAKAQLELELFKTPDTQTIIIRSAYLRTSNKQKNTLLEVLPAGDGGGDAQTSILLQSAESSDDINVWFSLIDEALRGFFFSFLNCLLVGKAELFREFEQ